MSRPAAERRAAQRYYRLATLRRILHLLPKDSTAPERLTGPELVASAYRAAGFPLVDDKTFPLPDDLAGQVVKVEEFSMVPQLVAMARARPHDWWEKALAALWRMLRCPPRRLYAPSWAKAMEMFMVERQAQRWRPLEVHRLSKLP